MHGFFNVPQNYQHSRNCETGPPVYRPYPRRLDIIHQDIIGCITYLDKIDVTKYSIKCKPASSSFWVKVLLKSNGVNVCVFLKDKGGERPYDIYSSNFSAQVVLKLERSMMGHFVILIENIIQLIT